MLSQCNKKILECLKSHKKEVLLFLFLSAVNLRLLWFFDCFSLGFIILSEVFVVVITCIFTFPRFSIFWENLYILRDDLTGIEQELSQKHNLLGYDTFVLISYILSIIFLGSYPSMLTLCITLVICSIMFTIFWLRLYYVYKDNMLEKRFNFKTSNRLLTHNTIIKRFIGSYLFKKASWFCFQCVRYGLPAAPTMLYGGPKLIYGWDYRPMFANAIGYRFTALYHESETVYGLAMKYYLEDPSIAPKISDSNGHIDILKLLDHIHSTLISKYKVSVEEADSVRSKLIQTLQVPTSKK